MEAAATNRSIAGAFLRHNLSFLFTGLDFLPGSYAPAGGRDAPPDFFGVCVASSADPACDDYVLARLRELGVRRVRLDLAPDGLGGFPERFLDRLLDADFRVCLHPVQPLADAQRMPAPEAVSTWSRFLVEALGRHAKRLDMVEIGATCNRRRWAGYTPSGFLAAWTAAHGIVRQHGLRLAGPNVTDFEPIYNVGWLGVLSEAGLLPDVHTDNLFVERATEPEAFDHKLLGRRLAPLLRFNLVRKARLLDAVSRRYGIGSTVCPHVAWSRRRIDRVLADLDEKQADYVTRYACLALASGGLDAVYWGPLIGQREGLIDDGTEEYPARPHVTFYGRVAGDVARYRVRPAFHALATAVRMLSGARHVRSPATARGMEAHEFRLADGRRLYIAWTRNGRCALASDCYPQSALARATAMDRDGHALTSMPAVFTERPVYLIWPADAWVSLPPCDAALTRVRASPCPGETLVPVRSEAWEGLVLCRGAGDDPEALLPERLEGAAGRTVLRDRRNCVWTMPDPRDPARRLVVKRHQMRALHRRALQCFRPSKARRSWNGAHELRRRGIGTPAPVAFFERRGGPPWANCYYVYEMFEAAGSMRQAFNALAGGASEYLGVPASTLYEQLAAFISRLHERGVFFADLSAGNVLVRSRDAGFEFSLIDTGRARCSNRSVSMWDRLADLKRLCHPLTWDARRQFLRVYMRTAGRRWAWWMWMPFGEYDVKHVVKGWLKPVRRALRLGPPPGG